MFLSRWLYNKNKNNYKNNNNNRYIVIVDNFWDTDGSDGDDDLDDYTYSPPSRFFCKISKDRKLKKITEMVLYKKKMGSLE